MAEQINSLVRLGAVSSTDLSTVSNSMPRNNASRVAAPASTVRAQPGAAADGPSTTAASSAAGQGSAAQPSAQELEAAVKQANVRLASINHVMQLRVDRATGITIATIKNSLTGQVLQQIPSPDVMRFARLLAGWSTDRNVLVDLIA